MKLAITGHAQIGLVADEKTITLPAYNSFSLKEIKPRGWLRQQLEIMRNGSTGHLDEIYDKIKNDNGWLGGKGDGWEETPYWLDGATPLAYLLDDTLLQQKVYKYIDWTLTHQRPTGYFGPITATERKNIALDGTNCENGEDWWPKMVMLKTLQQYYSATGDKRVIDFMSKYFRYQLNTLQNCDLGKWSEWSKARGVENLLMVSWLYSITKEKFLIELSGLISKQSYPWSKWFDDRELIMKAALHQDDKNVMQRHSVNVAMGLKDPSLNYLYTGNKHFLQVQQFAFNDLMTLHGLPMGIFSGDEDLHGNGLIQGTELCTVVETMFSLEKIIEITGDVKYIDALERMTFNALPAQTSDDYNYKQYFQLPNQVQVARGALAFSVTQFNGMSNVFGTKSGYTCCYTNMHQGWTKFTAQLWHKWGENGVACLSYGPSELNTSIKGSRLKITETTGYPFEENIHFKITADASIRFPWKFRIPGWCKQAEIFLNGKLLQKEAGGQIITIDRTWSNNDEIRIHFPVEIAISRWASNSRTVERGPLVYALKIKEEWKKGHHEEAGDYFSIYPGSGWNYALLQDEIKDPAQFNVSLKMTGKHFPWNSSSAPIEITAKAKKLPSWKLQDGILYQPICDRSGLYRGPISDRTDKITLIPYGCTKLRVVAFPVVE